MQTIHCSPEITQFFFDPNIEWWWDNMSSCDSDSEPSRNVHAATSSKKVSPTTVIKTEDLANIIANKDRNDFKQIKGLQYFCGGDERHPDYPNHICARDVRQWLRDIKSRTPSQNWTDEGRLELTKQYSLGLVREYLEDIIDEHGHKREEVKKYFLAIFPSGQGYQPLMSQNVICN